MRPITMQASLCLLTTIFLSGCGRPAARESQRDYQPITPKLMPEVSFMALIGRTHFGLLDDGVDSSGVGLYGPGFVGSEFKMVYRGRGGYGLTRDNTLYLAVNDSMDNDNGLSLTVHLWIVRDGKVLDAQSVRPPDSRS